MPALNTNAGFSDFSIEAEILEIKFRRQLNRARVAGRSDLSEITRRHIGRDGSEIRRI